MSATIHSIEFLRLMKDVNANMEEALRLAEEAAECFRGVNLADLPPRKRTRVINDYLEAKLNIAISRPEFKKAMAQRCAAIDGPLPPQEGLQLLYEIVPDAFEVYLKWAPPGGTKLKAKGKRKMTLIKAINLASAALGMLGTIALYKGSFAFEPGGFFYDDVDHSMNKAICARNRRRQLKQRVGVALIGAAFALQVVAQFADWLLHEPRAYGFRRRKRSLNKFHGFSTYPRRMFPRRSVSSCQLSKFVDC
jgi:hypothetical protein